MPQYPHCPSLNEATLERVRELKPDIVLLHGSWNLDPEVSVKLELTLQALQEIGVARVIVMGPMPGWRKPLSRVLMLLWGSSFPPQMPPIRITAGLTASSRAYDQIISDIARKYGAEYLSPYQALCNEEGCISRLEGANGVVPLLFDEDHMTPDASRMLMQQLAPQIFKP